MVFLAVLVFGYVGFLRLPVELMPDISYPTITVRTAYEGAAPEEVEDQISQPVEAALATLDGLVTMESRSRAENSDVILGFDWGTDMAQASQAVRESLQTTFLPNEADRPLILRYDPSNEPFLRLALSYDPTVLDLSDEDALFLLREIAEKNIKRSLEGQKGVAAVRVSGGLEREVRVEVNENWLAARQVQASDIQNALLSENINLAGGSIFEGDTEYLVRTLNEMKTTDDLNELEIRRSDGINVPLRDVARVYETHKERKVVTHLDGAEAVELELFKEADANVVEVSNRMKSLLTGQQVRFSEKDLERMPDGPRKDYMKQMLESSKGLQDRLPPGIRLELLDDQAAFIEMAIDNLVSSVVLGGFFAILVLYLFLGDGRATTIIGLSIPISVIIGFGPLYMLGVSLNLMSLGGLALGVGMLVDNAVVVLESIQRQREAGESPVTASVTGVSQVALAVVASTLTTVAVFAPISFISGVGGELFGDLSSAVVGSLVASLAVALFLVPTLAALSFSLPETGEADETLPTTPETTLGDRLAEVKEGIQGSKWMILALPYTLTRALLTSFISAFVSVASKGSRLFVRSLLWVGRLVGRPLAWLARTASERFRSVYSRLEHRYGKALAGIIKRPWGIIATAVALFVGAIVTLPMLGSELIPEIHQGRFTVDAALPVGTPLKETSRQITALERDIQASQYVDAIYTTIGSDGQADADSDEGEHSAKIRVQLKPSRDVVAQEQLAMEEVRQILDQKATLTSQISRPALFSFRTPFEVVVFNPDLQELRRLGDATESALSGQPGLTDVSSSLQSGNPEIQLSYDRVQLTRFGLTTNAVATKVRNLIQGVKATQLHQGDQRIDLRVQLSEQDRASLDNLRNLNINPQVQPPIPLESVATFTEGIGPSEIRRKDQRRAVVVSANLVGFNMSDAIERLPSSMATIDFDDNTTWGLGGQASEMSESVSSMQWTLILAIFLVYIIMASTFENVVQPFIILFSVPLALIGVVVSLGVAGLPVSIVASIGMVVLAGVVVNNAIVLVDAIKQQRMEGKSLDEAIVAAATLRLRPILITTATTVLGLLPLTFGSGAGAEIQRPLAVAVVGGLSASTLLTLVVIPAIYRIVATTTQRFRTTEASP